MWYWYCSPWLRGTSSWHSRMWHVSRCRSIYRLGRSTSGDRWRETGCFALYNPALHFLDSCPTVQSRTKRTQWKNVIPVLRIRPHFKGNRVWHVWLAATQNEISFFTKSGKFGKKDEIWLAQILDSRFFFFESLYFWHRPSIFVHNLSQVVKTKYHKIHTHTKTYLSQFLVQGSHTRLSLKHERKRSTWTYFFRYIRLVRVLE